MKTQKTISLEELENAEMTFRAATRENINKLHRMEDHYRNTLFFKMFLGIDYIGDLKCQQ